MENENEQLNREIIYKGCTRPAMIFGIPIIPFILGVGGGGWIGLLISPPFALLFAGTFFFLFKMLCKNDEMFFHLLYVKLITKFGQKNKKAWGVDTYQPINYRKRK